MLTRAPQKFTEKQLDALARTAKGRKKLAATKHQNEELSDYEKRQAFQPKDVRGFDG